MPSNNDNTATSVDVKDMGNGNGSSETLPPPPFTGSGSATAPANAPTPNSHAIHSTPASTSTTHSHSRQSSVSTSASRSISSTPLIARLQVPLSIPLPTELVRKPAPHTAIDALGILANQPLTLQSKQVSSAIQALIPRAGCIDRAESSLGELQSSMRQLDVSTADMVEGLKRLEEVLARAAGQEEESNETRSNVSQQSSMNGSMSVPFGWRRLRSSYKSMLSSAPPSIPKSRSSRSSSQSHPHLFKRGMLHEYEASIPAELRSRRSSSAASTSSNSPCGHSHTTGPTISPTHLSVNRATADKNKVRCAADVHTRTNAHAMPQPPNTASVSSSMSASPLPVISQAALPPPMFSPDTPHSPHYPHHHVHPCPLRHIANARISHRRIERVSQRHPPPSFHARNPSQSVKKTDRP